MLKVSCNATDQIHHALAQCRFFGPPKLSKTRPVFTRRKDGALLSCSPTAKGPVLAVVSDRSGSVGAEGGTTTRVETGLGSLADRLRLGSLTEDGLSYKEKFIVRCYEVGINKTATVETIANLLQVFGFVDIILRYQPAFANSFDLFFYLGSNFAGYSAIFAKFSKWACRLLRFPHLAAYHLSKDEVGCNHAQGVGFSTDGFATTHTMRKLNLIWVTARMHIEIYKYPAWSDVVEIETWCQGEGRIGTRRDWILKDHATGQVIGRATSKWVMMNQETRRLQKVNDDVREEYLVFCPREPSKIFDVLLPDFTYGLVSKFLGGSFMVVISVLTDIFWLFTIGLSSCFRLAFPEENSSSVRKISKLEDPAQFSRLGLVPRRADLDMNQHVNNVTYIGWVLESMPQEIIDSHELQTITLDYRRECQHDDVVDSLTSVEPLEGGEEIPELRGTNGSAITAEHEQDCRQFLHVLRLSGDGPEINRGRTEWRKKPTR
ncbi:hypothetical protein FEM48_Zijuj09G0079800 [Ziziphus jujuba var. spinosa]|uniref:Acyl-[acyl-carrier-protein] hydrolase n=1 Tax=Ziziphus jujuba var. spinosa TaxID=714518 RepID=A0A978URS7_ZIZJJ|nr:hypothetical protein FEM48_Zijuj09G0079800 [Ziziphus jujuba var. spinosa]